MIGPHWDQETVAERLKEAVDCSRDCPQGGLVAFTTCGRSWSANHADTPAPQQPRPTRSTAWTRCSAG